MAQPARRAEPRDDPPVEDPEAVSRAYHYHRARRNARMRRKREASRARVRFIVAFTVLVALAIFLVVTIWNEVQKVFGL